MIRFNYLEGDRRRPFAAGFTAIEIDNRIRDPLAALLATIVFSVLVGSSALMRLHHAQGVYHAAAARLAADGPRLAELAALRAQAQAQARVNERVAAIRRANVMQADELVWIGNHLPAGVWLRSLRHEGSSALLEGTSERAADVGTALIALHAADPRLVWMHVDPSAGGAPVRYALRLETRP